MTSFAYNTEVIKDRPDSIEVLWDPKYAGHVGWRDDAVEAVQMAALATGQDMNNPADLDKVKEKLQALKPQIKTFWSSEDEWNKHLAAHDYDLAVYWSGSAARSKKAFNLPVDFVVPKEGAIGWYDGLSIAANAPNPEGAHKFIDFMVSPEFYVKWDTDVGAPASANAKANAPAAGGRDEPQGPRRPRGRQAAAVDGADDRRAARQVPGDLGRGQDLLRPIAAAGPVARSRAAGPAALVIGSCPCVAPSGSVSPSSG